MIVPSLSRAAVVLSLAQIIFASPKVIAHRGAFHDTADANALPENSFRAVRQAFNLKLPGVELDLRLTSDNQVIVVHDTIANRATIADEDFGYLNPINVALGSQKATEAVYFNTKPLATWSQVELKNFGRNGQILPPSSLDKIQSLTSMLTNLKPFLDHGTALFLDIQDPVILQQSAKIVKDLGLQEYVYLKFFAKKALNSGVYKYAGPATCTQITKNYNLAGLNIIPQFNDGELNSAGQLEVFQTTLSAAQYLDCWLGAQGQPSTTATLAMVAASAPAPSVNQPAFNTAVQAMAWANKNNREKIAIIPNPDAGRRNGSECVLWTWRSDAVPAGPFDMNGRNAKQSFSDFVEPDFIITDIMVDAQTGLYDTDIASFKSFLC